ncbi:hypothetical protein, partial [Flavonifractor plautii]
MRGLVRGSEELPPELPPFRLLFPTEFPAAFAMELPIVGLSNKLDGEFARRKPAKRSHREVVRAAVMDSELLGEVIEG